MSFNRSLLWKHLLGVVVGSALVLATAQAVLGDTEGQLAHASEPDLVLYGYDQI